MELLLVELLVVAPLPPVPLLDVVAVLPPVPLLVELLLVVAPPPPPTLLVVPLLVVVPPALEDTEGDELHAAMRKGTRASRSRGVCTRSAYHGCAA